jgi:hypothetical protein
MNLEWSSSSNATASRNANAEECKRYTDDFPLTKAGLLEWFFIPVQVPLPIEALFRDDVDTKEPYDRTLTAAARAMSSSS